MLSKIMVTGSNGVLGHGMRGIASRYPDLEFVFATREQVDLSNFEALGDYISDTRPDAIVHLAALSGGIGYSKSRPATLLRDNLVMDFNILEAARGSQVQKVVMSLSVGMYSDLCPLPLKEEYIHDGPAHESNYSYAYGKRIIEPAIKAYRMEYGLNAIGLVPNGIFGERSDYNEDRAVMLAALIRRFHENRENDDALTVWGDGSPLREYTYSESMAGAYMWCLLNYNEEQILNVGTSEEKSVKDVAFMVAEFLAMDPKRITFDTSKPNGVARRNTDNSKFIELSGYAHLPFREGLRRTIGWFVQHYPDPEKLRL